MSKQYLVASYVTGLDLMPITSIEGDGKYLRDLLNEISYVDGATPVVEYGEGALWLEIIHPNDGLKGDPLYFSPGFASMAVCRLMELTISNNR